MQYCSIHGITGVMGVHEGSVRPPEPVAQGGTALSTACGRNSQIAVARGSIMRAPCGKRRLCQAQPRCADGVARFADEPYWPPPLPSQVCCVNTSPPQKPLPVLMLQCPPDSHAA